MNITIVGGGFGGVKAALELAKNKANMVTLITDKPDFQYYPALYGAATGRSHLESWVPLRKIFAGKKNVTVVIDTIEGIQPSKNTLTSKDGTIHAYENCILALGTVTTYFGIEGLDKHAYGIKSAAEIDRLKQHVYESLTEGENVDKRYVVVGAGPTGVELAAAFGSYLKQVCRKLKIKHSNVHIDLIEAAPRVLPRMSEEASARVHRRLTKLGVNVQTGKTVESADANSVTVSGQAMASHTVIWTSGVANHPFYKANSDHFTLAPNGRVEVDTQLSAGYENLYVIGDNAATPFTGLAQTALHDGIFVADVIMKKANDEKLPTYKAVMPPVVVPVGARWAIVEWCKLQFGGWAGAIIRRAADFMGYSDILPLGTALGVWRAGREKNVMRPSVVKK